MKSLQASVEEVRAAQKASGKPFAIVLAGHNGSGKSTMWYDRLADEFQIPLVNADRMMMSILPEPRTDRPFPEWATSLRDHEENWMFVAQRGVQALVAHAMTRSVSFALETVFSEWRDLGLGKIASKVDLVRDMQKAEYFVLLLFVGLSSAPLSVGRVATRVARGGHAVAPRKLLDRFPRTQRAVTAALDVADAAILVDNSRTMEDAFTVCHVRLSGTSLYDLRDVNPTTPAEIYEWLNVVVPRH
jgi:predicted ABC-type ATPase